MSDWLDILAVLVVCLYGLASAYLTVFGLHLYLLLFLSHRRRDGVRAAQRRRIDKYNARTPADAWPVVTTQILLYNEAAVAQRVIEAAAAMDYPPDRHEIHILDDSADETRHIVDRVATRLRLGGTDVQVIRRPDRTGYKAGALAHGLPRARGEVIALFDADFVPPPDFLRRTVPLLMDSPDNACVQGRWAHLNAGHSWITQAQSLAIDGHFAVEQSGRSWNHLPLNFNGTAGIWRRAAIQDPAVGGWTADTITEDLDLSYRAQMAGWRIEYCTDVECPAELPVTIPALKAQQYRWAKGSIQTARKLLGPVWRSPFTRIQRLEATLHLTTYSIAVWMLLLGLLSLPLSWINPYRILGNWSVALWGLMAIGLTAPTVVYCYARRILGGGWSGLLAVPYLMVLGAGLCLNNAVGVCEGLFRRGGEFVRTPKTGGRQPTARPRSLARQSSFWMLELLAAAYCALSFIQFARSGNTAAGLFLLIYTLGFAIVGFKSRPVRARPLPDGPEAHSDLPALAPALMDE